MNTSYTFILVVHSTSTLERKNTVGEIIAIKVTTGLMKSYDLPENMRITWMQSNKEQTSNAERVFYRYLKEGWIAFNEDDNGRKQILSFDPKLRRIVLIPPIGGG